MHILVIEVAKIRYARNNDAMRCAGRNIFCYRPLLLFVLNLGMAGRLRNQIRFFAISNSKESERRALSSSPQDIQDSSKATQKERQLFVSSWVGSNNLLCSLVTCSYSRSSMIKVPGDVP